MDVLSQQFQTDYTLSMTFFALMLISFVIAVIRFITAQMIGDYSSAWIIATIGALSFVLSVFTFSLPSHTVQKNVSGLHTASILNKSAYFIDEKVEGGDKIAPAFSVDFDDDHADIKSGSQAGADIGALQPQIRHVIKADKTTVKKSTIRYFAKTWNGQLLSVTAVVHTGPNTKYTISRVHGNAKASSHAILVDENGDVIKR